MKIYVRVTIDHNREVELHLEEKASLYKAHDHLGGGDVWKKEPPSMLLLRLLRTLVQHNMHMTMKCPKCAYAEGPMAVTDAESSYMPFSFWVAGKRYGIVPGLHAPNHPLVRPGDTVVEDGGKVVGSVTRIHWYT